MGPHRAPALRHVRTVSPRQTRNLPETRAQIPRSRPEPDILLEQQERTEPAAFAGLRPLPPSGSPPTTATTTTTDRCPTSEALGDQGNPRAPRRGRWRRGCACGSCNSKAWHAEVIRSDPLWGFSSLPRTKLRHSLSLTPAVTQGCSPASHSQRVYRRLQEPMKGIFWGPGEKGNPVATAPPITRPPPVCW